MPLRVVRTEAALAVLLVGGLLRGLGAGVARTLERRVNVLGRDNDERRRRRLGLRDEVARLAADPADRRAREWRFAISTSPEERTGEPEDPQPNTNAHER